MREQQRGPAFPNLFTHPCHQSLGHVLQDHRLQRKDRCALAALHQAAAAQGVQRLQHLAGRGGIAHIFPERLQRDQLAFNGQPVHQFLLQGRESRKLLRQELADAVKGREALRQEGGNIPVKEFLHRLRHDFEGQRITGMALHQVTPGLLWAEEAPGLQQLLAGWQLQATQPEDAHRSLFTGGDAQLRELLAAGQQQATVMGGLGHVPDQGGIPFKARAVASLRHALLEERFQVVEHQQAAPLLQEPDQQGQTLVEFLWQGGRALLCQQRQPVAQDVLQGGGIVQGAPQNAVEVRGYLLHQFGRQARLTDASHAQHGHQAAAVSQQPVLQVGQFAGPSVPGRDIERLTPVSPQQARGGTR